MTFLQSAFGRSVSETVTDAAQVVVFPATSVAVTVTVFPPRLAQVNNDDEPVKDKIPQLSVGLFAGGEPKVTVPRLVRNAVIV